jgi:hypothetical protein
MIFAQKRTGGKFAADRGGASHDLTYRLNRTRADFAEKFEALIESCNAGNRIDSLFEELLKLAIEDTLDSGLPRVYTPELYRRKCSAVFEHVYESYAGLGAG